MLLRYTLATHPSRTQKSKLSAELFTTLASPHNVESGPVTHCLTSILKQGGVPAKICILMSLGYADRLKKRTNLGGQLGACEYFESIQDVQSKVEQVAALVRFSKKRIINVE